MDKSPVLRATFAWWGRPDVARHEQREAILILTYANRHGKPPKTENRRDGLRPRHSSQRRMSSVAACRALAGLYKLFRCVDASTVMPIGYCVILYDLPREPKMTKPLRNTGFLQFCTK
jgi:hypothetical protein